MLSLRTADGLSNEVLVNGTIVLRKYSLLLCCTEWGVNIQISESY